MIYKNKRQQRFKNILDLIIEGKTNAEIASILGFSLITIKKDVSFLFKKYKVKNRIELAIEYFAELQVAF